MTNLLKKISDHFAVTLLLAVVVGVILGSIMGESVSMLAPLGKIFTRLLSMLVPVLVLFSIASSFANIGDARKMTKWGGKVIGWFIVTTTVATLLGIACGLFFKPGMGLAISGEAQQVTKISVDNFISWLPDSFLGCIADKNTIQIVFLAIFIGIAVVCMKDGKSKDTLKSFLNAGQDLILQIVKGVMYYAPIGIAALTATSVVSMKGSLLSEMAGFLSAYSVAFVLQVLLCYFVMLKIIGKVNPFRFTRKLLPAIITAFTTTSSASTMPVTLECVKDMGVDDEVADFGIPLGVTFNMDSMGLEIPLYIMLGMYAIGQNPTFGNLLLFVVMGIAFSVGCAGVPGGGLAIAVILVNAFGLPTQVVAWIAAVFFFLDTTGTAMNIWGDACCSLIVARTEGLLDETKFNS